MKKRSDNEAQERSGEHNDNAILALGVTVFIGIFGLVGLYQGIEMGQSESSENYADSHKRYAADKIQSACIGLDSPLIAKCIKEAIDASIENQRAEKDLAAQQNMATYAKWLLAVSTFTAAVTAFGVWYVRDTLAETRRAVRSADDTVKVTRETGRDQMRAYVDVSDVVFFWGSYTRDAPSFRLCLINHGQTPAKWFEVRQNFLVFEHREESPVPPSFDSFDLPEKFGDRWYGLSPGKPDGTTTIGPAIKRPDALNKCWRDKPTALTTPKDNTHGVLVFGEIRYCTIFDEVYRSQFLFGIGSLEAFEAKETIEDDRVEVRGITHTFTTTVEKAQKLKRIPIGDLTLYKREA